MDLDASLVIAHTDHQQGAAGTYKHTFGFHPLLAYLDHGNGRGEALAGLLRTGSAAANDTADHLTLLRLALAQLPVAEHRRLLVRTDSRGATIPVLWWLHERKLRFSVGLAADAHVRDAVLSVPDACWTPGDRAGRQRARWRLGRRGHRLAGPGFLPARDPRDLPPRTPHPGAPVRFTDAQGRRYQVFVTNQADWDVARLELGHRQHARIEDRIRAGKATGLANFPFDAWWS